MDRYADSLDHGGTSSSETCSDSIFFEGTSNRIFQQTRAEMRK